MLNKLLNINRSKSKNLNRTANPLIKGIQNPDTEPEMSKRINTKFSKYTPYTSRNTYQNTTILC